MKDVNKPFSIHCSEGVADFDSLYEDKFMLIMSTTHLAYCSKGVAGFDPL